MKRLMMLFATTLLLGGLNAHQQMQSSTIHEAAAKGDLTSLCMFLSAGMPVDVLDSNGRSPFSIAIQNKQRAIVNFLIAREGKKDSAGKSALVNEGSFYEAIHAGYIELINICLDAGVNVNSKDDCPQSPLVVALQCKNKEVVELLIARGATIATGGVLCAAAIAGNVEIVKSCLDAGVDVYSTLEAFFQGFKNKNKNKEVVELLIARGANTAAGNLLLWLLFNANIKKFMLLDDPERLIIDDDMKIAFCFMAKFGDTKAIRYLLATGIPAGCTDAAGNTALSLARKAGNQEIVDLLTAYGATPLSAA